MVPRHNKNRKPVLTFSDLDLGAGVTLGHIFDTSHYLRHGGRFVMPAV
jgi:hypothetical protein